MQGDARTARGRPTKSVASTAGPGGMSPVIQGSGLGRARHSEAGENVFDPDRAGCTPRFSDALGNLALNRGS